MELDWFKSSYSSGEGGTCVEVAYNWRKSSHIDAEGDECLEVATCPTTIHVRATPGTPPAQLAFAPARWSAFVTHTQSTRVDA
ncbi:DUF397 domain-containing protein [Streptomyces sp. NPDC059909]|uniref:DUF397 domain-containing protein n=1 Tax=Streptomyces sp. NPDC059909 TaxID=3346998 RepID=UPI003660FC1E